MELSTYFADTPGTGQFERTDRARQAYVSTGRLHRADAR